MQSNWIRSGIKLFALVWFSLLGFIGFSVKAQSLNVEPLCGKPGTSVKITGSGWAEPAPACDYLFYFDGAEFTGRQPDGLFGPPNKSGVVPSNASVGDHKIKVELRITSNGQLLQCRQTKFKVVTDILDPLKNNVSPTVGNSNVTGAVDFTFDPKDVCDVTPCTKISWIHSVKLVGEKSNGTTQTLTYSQIGFPSAASHQADTVNGVAIDRLAGRPAPYYGSDASGNSPTSGSNRSGVQGSTPRSANMVDKPSGIGPPAGFAKFRAEFEANAFCSEGQNKGEFPGGRVIWKYESTSAAPGTATVIASTRDQPSQSFKDALDKWDTNRATWSKPTPSPAPPGGEQCN